MDKGKWKKDAPLELLALKLCEEAAEVGKEISDAFMEDRGVNANVLTELAHVEFLVRQIRRRVA